ncbi:PH domain-containing protein [Staphylococcus sp. ACRSN]|uniref:PH domain-containing protein n=1 Tax=Staphylococcus sp. ACRSN TaxID=2918214 RepID=UPI001EF26EA3|nr:PH domain-containing protein [Staphylococcus sp. ACRSN]MCG7340039.1 PH domain-containing protein [Staphylococcus sp. ACRSN]
MEEYKQMATRGKKAIRLNYCLWFCAYIIISIAIFVMNKLWLNWLHESTNLYLLIILISLSVLYLLYGVILLPMLYFKLFKYKIDKHEVVIIKGIWSIKKITLPLFRIQNVDTHRGMLMRKYNLSTITLSTAGGNERIKLIDDMEAENIKKRIKYQTEDDNTLE